MLQIPGFKKTVLPALIATVFAYPYFPLSAAEEQEDEKKNDDQVLVVVGAKIKQELDDVAGSVSVMTDEQIQKQAVSDMSDLFRYEPGIEVSGSSGTAQNIMVRGMGGDRIMMVKDGMRMNEGYGADGANDVVGRGFIDIDTIKQVEVGKGASSSLFGADALGGVVVFTTKDPEDILAGEDFFLKIKTNYDQRSNLHGAGFLTAFGSGDFSTMMNYRETRADETKNYADSKDPRSVDGRSILLKSTYKIDNHQKVSFTADLFYQETDFSLSTWHSLPVNIFTNHRDQENTSYTISYSHTNAETPLFDSIDVNLYNNNTEQVDDSFMNINYFGSYILEKTNVDKLLQDTSGLSLSLFKKLKTGDFSHGISYGLDLDSSDTSRPRHEVRINVDEGVEIKNEHFAPFPQNDTVRGGLYLQDQIEVGDFQIIPGVRYDYYKMDPDDNDPLYLEEAVEGTMVSEFSENNLSPRLGVIYTINDNLNLYGQYSSGFKVPPYDLAYLSVEILFGPVYGIKIEPAEDLVPEESDSYEIGLRGQYQDFNFTLATYNNAYDNMIVAQFVRTDEHVTPFGTAYIDVSQYQNIESATIKGVELSAQYAFNDMFTLYGNYNMLDATNDETGDYLTSMRPNSGTLGLTTFFNNQLTADLITRYASDMTKNNEGYQTTSGYVVFDLMINVDITDNLRMNFSIFNLSDEEYTQYGTISGMPESNTKDWSLYTETPRSVSVRFDYTF